MNSGECRKRAEECLAVAQYVLDHDAQRMWRQLSDLWMLWSERLVQLNRRSEDNINAENSKRSVAVAEPIIQPPISRNREALEMADRLRLRLALKEMNGD